jgi:hypothetical protein
MNPGEAPGKFLVNGEEGYMRPAISHDLAARCGAFHIIIRTSIASLRSMHSISSPTPTLFSQMMATGWQVRALRVRCPHSRGWDNVTSGSGWWTWLGQLCVASSWSVRFRSSPVCEHKTIIFEILSSFVFQPVPLSHVVLC